MMLSSRKLGGVVVGASLILGLTTYSSIAQDASSRSHLISQAAPLAAPSQRSSNMLARLSLRITELENEIRRLTGQNEELVHRLGQLEDQLKQSKSDTALRLSALERGGGSAKSSNSTPTPLNAGAKVGNVVPLKPKKTAVSGADKGAKTLGSIRTNPETGKVANIVRPPPIQKSETPEQKYDRAHSLIVKQRKYGEAEQVLRQFIDANPDHALTSNAHYWLGRTYFVRADYENAAFAFAEGFQKFPEAKKAPANLLNLGMSLARLGKNREACTTYTRLLRNYKNAESSIKRRVTRERRRAKCRSR